MYSEKTDNKQHIKCEWRLKYILENICELDNLRFTENETIPDELKKKLRETETYINIYFDRRNRG